MPVPPATRPRRVAVIGAGPMGLAAALDLAEAGDQVTVFERDDRIGGMSAHQDFAGTRLERYYHFVCAPDHTLFEWLARLGLEDTLRWRRTHMGFFHGGQLHDWGGPLALLRFPGLNLWQKLRYAAHVMRAKSITDWRPYDRFGATEWLRRWLGEHTYRVMWQSLFALKFHEHQESLSAAWLGTRIRRVALSRRSLFEERLGYIEGGSERLLQAIAERLRALGATLELATPVQQVQAAEGRVQGLRVGGVERPFEAVVSTIPLPYLVPLIPALPPGERAQVAAVRNIGVVCVLLKLARPFTRNFWMNINDPRIAIPGLIEYSNLNPLDGSGSIVYAPFYLPQSHPNWQRPHAWFVEQTLAAMQLIQPAWSRNELLAATASRYEYAQAVCTPGFHDALPPMQSALAGLYMADTSHYYPEDRSISESLRIGAELARLCRAGGAAA